MGPKGLGYYQDIDPLHKSSPEEAVAKEEVEEAEEEEEPQTKWDWVQEARSGGPSKELTPPQPYNLIPITLTLTIESADTASTL